MIFNTRLILCYFMNKQLTLWNYINKIINLNKLGVERMKPGVRQIGKTGAYNVTYTLYTLFYLFFNFCFEWPSKRNHAKIKANAFWHKVFLNSLKKLSKYLDQETMNTSKELQLDFIGRIKHLMKSRTRLIQKEITYRRRTSC